MKSELKRSDGVDAFERQIEKHKITLADVSCFFEGKPKFLIRPSDLKRRSDEMKEYTTGEMIMALEKNPKLIFTGEYGALQKLTAVIELERLVLRDACGKAVCLNALNLNRKWTLVRTPVTWQEAIQAWMDGKAIKCDCNNCCGGSPGHCFSTPVCITGKFCGYGIKHGQWFILEDSADE